MSRQAQPIALRPAERLELQRWVAAHGTPQQVAQRCQIILSAAEGQQDKTIAAGLQINFKTVALWRARFEQGGDGWFVGGSAGTRTETDLGGPDKIQASWMPRCAHKPKGMRPSGVVGAAGRRAGSQQVHHQQVSGRAIISNRIW